MLTIGVEEEYLLVDPVTGVPVTRAAAVREAAGLHPVLDEGEVQPELLQAQLEVATPVCRELDEVGGHLLRLRHALAEAAQQCGCLPAASGTAPFTDREPVPVTPSPRYRQMRQDAPALIDEQLINGMHVHVGVPDREAGVVVLNRLRPWLPVLTALAANSPLWRGADTGFASWRTIVFGRWPVSGCPPPFADAADYDRRIRTLVDGRLVRDTGQLYWQARLSERYPTVEVRAMDVQLRPDEAVVLAGIVRGLAARALQPGSDGGCADPLPELLRSADWHAARYGSTEELFDPLAGRLRRAEDTVRALLGHVEAQLDRSGDRRLVTAGLERLFRHGNGAVRQRAELRHGGRAGLTGMITEETAGR
ncbi:carboxylate-amine ligase [Kitasatospora phosalacinea]|uniref:carboxylate-amine ligase n=1 Tax=Kitasatospora phosalacinea TaxID=2065 RepID=UPI0005246134|nr:glutamate--cysteine ligase [Kitasatospora phosalacinea]